MTSFNDRRRERLHLEECSDALRIVSVYPMGDDTFLTEERGEVSLLDRVTLKSLLNQLSGRDVSP